MAVVCRACGVERDRRRSQRGRGGSPSACSRRELIFSSFSSGVCAGRDNAFSSDPGTFPATADPTGIGWRTTGGDGRRTTTAAASPLAARPTARTFTPLPPVTPSPQNVVPRETAYGPVRGYVATRSAGGTKTDTPLIETPQSISVITRDQMDAQAVQSVSQALNYTAGVVAQPRGSVNGYYEFPFIRGFAPTNFLYLDGMQLLGASAGLQIEPYGLERIEVIKGPASILYGQGPPSGIISMISKRPTEVPFREILCSSRPRSPGVRPSIRRSRFSVSIRRPSRGSSTSCPRVARSCRTQTASSRPASTATVGWHVARSICG